MLFLAPEGCLDFFLGVFEDTRLGKEYALILVHPYPIIPTLWEAPWVLDLTA
jgi:hypothetical protein